VYVGQVKFNCVTSNEVKPDRKKMQTNPHENANKPILSQVCKL
jgi:hypothetical protein